MLEHTFPCASNERSKQPPSFPLFQIISFLQRHFWWEINYFLIPMLSMIQLTIGLFSKKVFQECPFSPFGKRHWRKRTDWKQFWLCGVFLAVVCLVVVFVWLCFFFRSWFFSNDHSSYIKNFQLYLSNLFWVC